MKKLVIDKNRGWRGLARAKIIDIPNHNIIASVTEREMLFTFSSAVWKDLIERHKIVMEDDTNYLIVHFEEIDARFPRVDQQRTVLIKHFITEITEITEIPKDKWTRIENKEEDRNAIYNYRTNNNRPTTSDWNCLGIRVRPTI